MSLLDFDMSDENERDGVAGNMSHSIGTLINRSLSNGYDPQRFDRRRTAQFGYHHSKFIKCRQTCETTNECFDLSAHLSFVRLHSSRDVVFFSASNELCYAFIITMPLRDKGYAYLKDLDFIDEFFVVRAGFFYFY